jgi:putative toxin-antitoxin system antitoxin component (TIGR02293 family)
MPTTTLAVLLEIDPGADPAEAAQAGLTLSALDAVTAAFGFTPVEIERAVVPRKTVARKRSRGQRLGPDESARLMRLARVALRAQEKLGSAAEAVAWLRQRNRTLQGHLPLEMLDTDNGARMVEAVLGRIDAGVAS